jgi:hypothetical protein
VVLSIGRRLVIFTRRIVVHAACVADRTLAGMQVLAPLQVCVCVLSASCGPAPSARSTPSRAEVAAAAPVGAPQRDGAHDFDWDIGTWTTHQRRLLHPLTGSTTWVEYTGTDVVRRLWDGANEALIEADGPAGHLEIFALRFYDPEARQWSVHFANRAIGSMGPPVIGGFRDGRGDFYDQEPYGGRIILVRFSVSEITPTSCLFEQAFSADGGKTWEPNFVVTETRVD